MPARDGEPALVFLHYFGGSGRVWDGVVAQLGTDYEAAAPDLRGFGSAGSMPGPYTLGAYAEEVEDLIHRRGFERTILVGHSMGGKIALSLAARRPAWLAGLVLVAPSPPTPEPMSEADRAGMLAGYGQPAAALATARKIVARPLAPALLAQVVEDMLRSAEPAWAAWLQEGSREDISAGVGRLSVPAVVVSGTQDKTIPTSVLASEVLPRLERGRLVTIPDAGHLLPLEAADEVAGLVAALAWGLSHPSQRPESRGAFR